MADYIVPVKSKKRKTGNYSKENQGPDCSGPATTLTPLLAPFTGILSRPSDQPFGFNEKLPVAVAPSFTSTF